MNGRLAARLLLDGRRQLLRQLVRVGVVDGDELRDAVAYAKRRAGHRQPSAVRRGDHDGERAFLHEKQLAEVRLILREQGQSKEQDERKGTHGGESGRCWMG